MQLLSTNTELAMALQRATEARYMNDDKGLMRELKRIASIVREIDEDRTERLIAALDRFEARSKDVTLCDGG